jgi:hypothetical protein
MQHSKVLETMTITSACGLEKNQMLLKLSSCTMRSTTCKLTFIWLISIMLSYLENFLCLMPQFVSGMDDNGFVCFDC